MPNLQHQLLSTTDPGKLVYYIGTDSPQPLPAPYKRLIHDINTTNDLTSLTDRDRPITTNLRHSSLTANNITAKLTNQFIQIGLSIFD